jgi:carbon-monoxide dehydrogenase medium subunit
MYNFNYHQAKSIDEASKLATETEEGKLMAGGMTLIPTLKQRLAKPSDVIDLAKIPELKGIKKEGNNIIIGSMTRHYDVFTNELVKQHIPGLSHLAGHIGDPHVRNRGTIGGSIANSDPAADYPSSVVALNATIITNKRQIPGDEFFLGLFETALEPGELITAVSYPIPEKSAYMKFPNPASRYAVVGVFVMKTGNTVRVGVTGAGACAFRQKDMEAALTKSFTP